MFMNLKKLKNLLLSFKIIEKNDTFDVCDSTDELIMIIFMHMQ